MEEEFVGKGIYISDYNYTSMGVDEAMMVVIGCNVGCEEGRICYNTVDFFPITEEAYRKIRKKQAEQDACSGTGKGRQTPVILWKEWGKNHEKNKPQINVHH